MRVAFMMQGNGTSWIGGTEYIRNLVISCGNLPAEERSQLELVLVCDETFDRRSVSDLDQYLARTYQFPADLPPVEAPASVAVGPAPAEPVEVSNSTPSPAELGPKPRGWAEKLLGRIFRQAAARKAEAQKIAIKAQKEAQKAALKAQKVAAKAREEALRAAAHEAAIAPHRPNGQMADFLEQEQIDFLYPVIFHRYESPIGKSLGNCRWAGWVPDFQYRHMPEFYAPDVLAWREAGLTSFFNDARTIIFSSYNAEGDYKRFYPSATAGGEVMRFHTYPQDSWYEGDPVEVQQRFNLPDKFLIVSNQFWQHKNHMGLFEAMALLRAEGAPVPHIVCTGHPTDERNPRYIDKLLRTIHEYGLAEYVRLVGLIERAEQILLVRRSVAVIQPSLFEGWSTIVEDSRILGKRMVMSDIAVHKEQAPPDGTYFEQASARSLADELSKVWESGTPGPDLERESNARRQGVEDALAYARQFLAIARNAP